MFTAEKSALIAALDGVRDVVNRKNTIPILGNVLFERHPEGGLQARATNLDTEIRRRFEAAVAADFEPFTVPALQLVDIVKSMSGAITLEAERDGTRIERAIVKAGRAKVKVPVLQAIDMPSLDKDDLPFEMTLSGPQFSRAVAAVSFAASTEETRAYLNGVYFHKRNDDGLMLVATDGHRLSHCLISSEHIRGDVPDFPGVILPRDMLGTIEKSIPKSGDITIALSDEKFRMTADGLALVTKLVDGTYPDYPRTIPIQNDIVVTCDGPSLTAAITRVLTVNTAKGNGVSFSAADGLMRLVTPSTATGEAEDEIEIEMSAPISIGLNGKYLAEAIAHIEGDEIEMLLSMPGSPIIIRAPGREDARMVLMPMRLGGGPQ